MQASKRKIPKAGFSAGPTPASAGPSAGAGALGEAAADEESIEVAIDDDKSDFFTSPLPTPREDVQGAAGTLADTTGRDPSPRPYQSAQFDKEGEEATEALASHAQATLERVRSEQAALATDPSEAASSAEAKAAAKRANRNARRVGKTPLPEVDPKGEMQRI